MDKDSWMEVIKPGELTLDMFAKSPEEAEAHRRARTPEENERLDRMVEHLVEWLDRSKTQEKPEK